MNNIHDKITAINRQLRWVQLVKREKTMGTRLTIKFKMAAYSAMGSFQFSNDLWYSIN